MTLSPPLIVTGGESRCAFSNADPAQAAPVYAVTPQTLDSGPAAPWRAWLEATGFAGLHGQIAVLPGDDRSVAGAVVGLGSDARPLAADFAFGAAARTLPEGDWRLETDGLDTATVEDAALGWLLGAYAFETYKPGPKAAARLVAPADMNAARIQRIATACAFGRDLINTPAEDMGPDALQAAFEALAAAYGAQTRVTIDPEALAQEFPLVHAVGRAGARAPRMLDLSLDMSGGDPNAPSLTLVGKGVCFDTGGLDIKPSNAMLLMKKDMGGAAAALTLARMLMDAALPIRLRLLIPAVENNIAADAFRPGDVFRSRAGLTVEIGNTDAEGRLVLADALTLAGEDSPDLLLNFATLTGAARVALGPQIVPFFTDGDDLAADIHAAGVEARDPLWRMPLWRPYDSDLSSPIADAANCGPGGFGGAITAALFLRKFVQDTEKWAHFDLYGWTPSPRGGFPKGGEAQAARALYEMLEQRYKREGADR